MSSNTSIRDRIYRSPSAKTAISIGSSVLIGIFSNTLVTEITKSDKIAWSSATSAPSFWGLILSCIVAFQFHRYLLAYETQVSAFKDNDFCLAYARSQLLPAQVAKSIEAISAGDLDQFRAAMTHIKNALK